MANIADVLKTKFGGTGSSIDDVIKTMETNSDSILTQMQGLVADARYYATQVEDVADDLRSFVGSPLTAATAEAMTNTEKVYVYTGSETGYTAGNWYYHNGTSWVSGGVYNATAVDLDTTLTQAGKAADADAVGKAIGNVKSDLTDVEANLEEVTVDGYNLLKDAENGVGAYYASGSTLTYAPSYTGYHYAIVPVDPNSRYYVSASPRWWVLTDDDNNVLSSGTGFNPFTKKFIDTGNATKFYYTIDNASWNNEINYGSKFALIIAKTNNGSGTFVVDKKPKAISGLTQRMSKNRYAFSVPRSRVMLTVGINQKWFYKNALALDSNTCTIDGGIYTNPEPDGVAFNISSPNANGAFVARAYDQNLALVEQQSQIKLIAKTDNVMDCSALAIGDSTVAQDKMTRSMLNAFADRNKTLTLLGTQGTSPNNHEGRSGWSAKQYCTQSANNPFYNNGFDFSYYMTNQEYSSVDFVVIQLGINDLFNAYGNFEDSDTAIDTTLGYLCDMINSILSWNASQKIIINLLTPVNPTWNGYPMMLIRNIFVRYNAKALLELTKYSLDNVRVSNCHLILDPYNDISDTVHPKDAGYEKMGLEVVSQINCYQNS